jgi:hypothetical protein
MDLKNLWSKIKKRKTDDIRELKTAIRDLGKRLDNLPPVDLVEKVHKNTERITRMER